MRTYVHQPRTDYINVPDKSNYKYFNHTAFKGIIEDENIYTLDQYSLSDTNNVYVDTYNHFVSRLPLVEDIQPINKDIIEIHKFGDINIYVTKGSTFKYDIISSHGSISCNLYNLCSIDHYIICFNDQGAKYIDTKLNVIWQDFSNNVYIPITKITSGDEIKELELNQFTGKYKHQYTISDNIYPKLPKNEDADVKVITKTNTIEYQLENADNATKYRLYKTLDYELADNEQLEVKNGTLCIIGPTYFKYSLNGYSWTQVNYPFTNFDQFNVQTSIYGLSENGQYFFCYFSDVYRYNIADQNEGWVKIEFDSSVAISASDNGKPINRDGKSWYFLSSEVFVIFDVYRKSIYYKRQEDTTIFRYTINSLPTINNPWLFLQYSNVLLDSYIKKNDDTYSVYILTRDVNSSAITNTYGIIITIPETTTSVIHAMTSVSNYTLSLDYQYSTSTSINAYSRNDQFEIFRNSAKIGKVDTSIPYSVVRSLNDGYIVYDSRTYFLLTSELKDYKLFSIDKFNTSEARRITIDNDYWYAVSNGKIYTNKFDQNDIIVLTYNYGEDTVYTEVPTVSYSDTELYLGFGKDLKISANQSDPNNVDNILFNLPPINNQSFIDNITGMRNISTTEVAIYFIDSVQLCSKTSDENYGIRYDYYKTKLSIGIRLGDSLINTLEGQFTVFPTPRGLARMSYQAYMATTDQVISYISDKIKNLWNEFYADSTEIHIIQHDNILYLSNGTNTILLYDLLNDSWWRWTLPVETNTLISDQVDLRVLSNKLYIFKEQEQYYDLGNKTIDWLVMSQPVHFTAPTYTKNIKQLIFHFYDDIGNALDTNRILAQIQVYRKKLDQRTADQIAFSVDGLRTFVKRFNYWKINELQWALANSTDTASPKQLKLNSISIKYSINEEVR